MTITVDLRPEVEAELSRQAAVRGRALEAHAATLLEDAAHVPVQQTQAVNLLELFEPVRGLLTDEEVDTLFSRNRSPGRPVDLA